MTSISGGSTTMAGRRVYLWASLAAATSFLIRVSWIRRLGIWGDEDISSLAILGILQEGLPVLPTGHLYWRAPIFHYLAAPLVGWGDWWYPRVLAAAFGAITAALIVLLGRRLVGGRAAVLAAFLYALCLYDIDLARSVRFYSLYQMVALVALFGAFLLWKHSRPAYLGVTVGLILMSLGCHELGATLAFVLLLTVACGNRAPIRFGSLLAIAGVGVVSLLQQRHISTGLTGGGPTLPKPVASDATGWTPEIVERLTAGTPILEGYGWLAVLPAAVFAIAGLLIGMRTVKGDHVWRRWIAIVSFVLALLLAGLHQFGDVAAVIAVVAILAPELLPDSRSVRGLFLVCCVAALAGLAWIVAGIATDHSLRATIVEMLGRTVRQGRYLVEWPPAITLPALAGALWVVVRSIRGEADRGPRFLVLAVLITVSSRAHLGDKVTPRYLADLWPLWELLAGWTIVQVSTRLTDRVGHIGLRRLAAGLPAVWLVVALVLPGTGARDVAAHLQRHDGDRAATPLHPPAFVHDIGDAVSWVKRNRTPGDRVAATDWLTTYYYLGELDYWVRTRNYEWQTRRVDARVVDIYVGAEVVSSVETLLEASRSGRIWVVAGGIELEIPSRKLDDEFREWLLAREPAYVAADGVTRVIAVEAGDP